MIGSRTIVIKQKKDESFQRSSYPRRNSRPIARQAALIVKPKAKRKSK
jgi:hypothetical protein